MNNKLEVVYVKNDKLIKLDNNPRLQIDNGATGKLRSLIRKHGFQSPLQVYKETGLCGNHRYDAGQLEGLKGVLVYRLQW